jgi:hypothetical protein
MVIEAVPSEIEVKNCNNRFAVWVVMHEKLVPTWALKVDYVETCNCDFGCPHIISVFFLQMDFVVLWLVNI